jgi:geranylgeranyl diphosphate synthase type II
MGSEDALDFKGYLTEKRAVVERALESCFPDPGGPASDLTKAMKYSVFAGGKRLRPVLCMAGAECVGGSVTDVLPVACALELIHTYSLIHDDLPVMDDDDLRRGKLANHKVFGEAMAILAGDGLLTEAFNLMVTAELAEKVSPHVILKVVRLIAEAAGYRGMVGGQVVDIQSEGKSVDFPTVEFIHAHKTGALITASVSSGAILGGGDEIQIEAVTSYGQKIGLAFQISDDILDIDGDTQAMGKRHGADKQKRKITYPSVVGVKKARTIRAELIEKAIESLHAFGNSAEPLRQIARYIIKRKR